MKHLLFLCSLNRLRSPTAEQVFAIIPGIETDSAGVAPDEDCPLSGGPLEWADVICVMQKRHQRHLTQRFKKYRSGKRWFV